MALIICPECGKSISDKAVSCPNCGLPSQYFQSASNAQKPSTENTEKNDNKTTVKVDYEISLEGIGNVLLTFDKDYVECFNPNNYISGRDQAKLEKVYGNYYKYLKNKLVFDYVCNQASNLRIDIDTLKKFLLHMHHHLLLLICSFL